MRFQNNRDMISEAADRMDRIKWAREAKENAPETKLLDELFISIALASRTGR